MRGGAAPNARRDRPWSDDGHIDPTIRFFGAQRSGDAFKSVLRHLIRPEIGEAIDAEYRRDDDDPPTTGAPHPRNGGFDRGLVPEKVRVEHVRQAVRAKMLDRARGAARGVGDEKVESAAARVRGVRHRGADAIEIRMVDLRRVEPFGPASFAILMAAATRKNAKAAPSQRMRDRQPKSAGTTADERRPHYRPPTFAHPAPTTRAPGAATGRHTSRLRLAITGVFAKGRAMSGQAIDDDAAEDADLGRRGIRSAFFALGLVTLVVAVVVLAADSLTPIVLALFVWFLINALANALRAAPMVGSWLPSGWSLVLSTALVLGVLWLIGGVVVSNVSNLGDGLEQLGPKAAATIALAEQAVGVDFGFDAEGFFQNLPISDVLQQIAGALTATANTIILVLLYVMFLLLDQRFYDQKIQALFPDEKRSERVREVLDRIGYNTRLYVWIMTIVSIGVGILTYAIARYFGLQAPVFWGFLAFALNYIPTIGSFLGVLFPAVFALVQFEAVETTLAFAAALAVVQFVAGNIIVPRLMGDQLNLSQFVVILSLTIWGSIWGVVGLFLAVPIMMVLAIVLSQFESTRPVAVLLSRTGNVDPAPRAERRDAKASAR